MSTYGKYSKDETSLWKYGILYKHPITKGINNSEGIETIVYYNSKQKSIVVHIQDVKGKTEVARDIFDFFAFHKPIEKDSAVDEKIEKHPYKKGIFLVDYLINNKRTQEHIERVDARLSTNDQHFIEIKEGIKNVDSNQNYGICAESGKRIELDFMAQNLLRTEKQNLKRVFLSYSHKDETYKNELDNHFSLLKRLGHIEVWHDRKIKAGDDWNEEIERQLKEADLVILFLSADFFTSDYIWNQELKIIRERGDQIKVVPIFVKPCDYEGFDMMRFQGGTRDSEGRPKWISSSFDKHAVYTEIVQNIKEALGIRKEKK
jgi:hypothetical protein